MRRNTPAISARVRRYVAQQGLKPRQVPGSVFAYVNHGRWVADCLCGGAELVSEGEPMLCGSCGAIRQVVWPNNSSAIESALEDRPKENQNWYTGETIAMLENESR